MPVKLPPASLKHLEGAPLQVALAQVRFAPVHAVEKPERVADFQEHLADTYIAREAQVPQTITIQFGPSLAQPGAPVAVPERVWPFEDRERGWSISLSSSSLALEASTYDDFDDFLAEFKKVLGALIATFAPREQARLGLRYVNEITGVRLQNQGLRQVLRPALLSPIGTELGWNVLGSLCELRFKESLGTLVLRHGLIRTDSYLLDFDYFTENPSAFDDKAIARTVKRFHDVIERLFVWCVSDGYLAELKGRTHAG
jgi:uncharacterized protein (TIGR04255 family)